MQESSELYRYIAVYVNDLLIAGRDLGEITQILEESHKFKLKGVCSLSSHLGCVYFQDKDRTLCYGPQKFIGKIMDQFKNIFWFNPKEYTSPLEKGDHLEIDKSEELNEDGVKKYQKMIGCLQWAVSLGRFDIKTATHDHVKILGATKDWTLEF
jgi:hypothetical protein